MFASIQNIWTKSQRIGKHYNKAFLPIYELFLTTEIMKVKSSSLRKLMEVHPTIGKETQFMCQVDRCAKLMQHTSRKSLLH